MADSALRKKYERRARRTQGAGGGTADRAAERSDGTDGDGLFAAAERCGMHKRLVVGATGGGYAVGLDEEHEEYSAARCELRRQVWEGTAPPGAYFYTSMAARSEPMRSKAFPADKSASHQEVRSLSPCRHAAMPPCRHVAMSPYPTPANGRPNPTRPRLGFSGAAISSRR